MHVRQDLAKPVKKNELINRLYSRVGETHQNRKKSGKNRQKNRNNRQETRKNRTTDAACVATAQAKPKMVKTIKIRVKPIKIRGFFRTCNPAARPKFQNPFSGHCEATENEQTVGELSAVSEN